MALVNADERVVPTFELVDSVDDDRSDDRATLAGFQAELDGYLRQMCDFRSMDPDEVLLAISAWSARACEMRSQVIRREGRRAMAFRTRQLEPFLEQCELQFKIHSRLVSIRQFEFDMSKGQV